MGPAFLRKYNTLLVAGTTSIDIPIIKVDEINFAVGADWTPAAGDVKVQTDAAAVANITNLPTAVTSGNTAFWRFILTASELSGKQVKVTIADSATKAVEDQMFLVETFGHASAMYQWDPQDAVRQGMTALPNAAADAAGGLVISDAGGFDIDGLLNMVKASFGGKVWVAVGETQVKLYDFAGSLLVTLDKTTDGSNNVTWTPTWA